MRIALTGGIACGKSLLANYLNELGVETLDADDIVHELIPEPERRRMADGRKISGESHVSSTFCRAIHRIWIRFP